MLQLVKVEDRELSSLSPQWKNAPKYQLENPAKHKVALQSRSSPILLKWLDNRSKKGCGAIQEGHSQQRFIRIRPSDSFLRLCTTLLWLRISAASNFLIDSLALQSTTTLDTKAPLGSECPAGDAEWRDHCSSRVSRAQGQAKNPVQRPFKTTLPMRAKLLGDWKHKHSLHSFLNVIFYNETFLAGTWLRKNVSEKGGKQPKRKYSPKKVGTKLVLVVEWWRFFFFLQRLKISIVHST